MVAECPAAAVWAACTKSSASSDVGSNVAPRPSARHKGRLGATTATPFFLLPFRYLPGLWMPVIVSGASAESETTMGQSEQTKRASRLLVPQCSWTYVSHRVGQSRT